MKFLILIAGFMLTQSSYATFSDDVLGTLYTMKNVYSAEYAPAAWKQEYAGYDLTTEFNKAVGLVQANPNLTQKEAQKIFINFIYAMKDYHTSISFVTTESATLPLVIRGTTEHEYIMEIDRTKLTETAFPYKVGDELVSMDGIPVNDVIATLQNTFVANVPGTDRSLAEVRVTSRGAARGITVPQGPVTLGILRQGETTVSFVQVLWDYKKEQVGPRHGFSLAAAKTQSNLLHPMMNVDVESGGMAAQSQYDMGARKTFTPDLGVKIWESDEASNFYAYIYKSADNKLIGYVRIPQYGADDYVKATAEFSKIIQRFQQTTDSMVIDQVNNPGGSVFYLYALASMLTEQPLVTPLHRMAITQADVVDAVNTLNTLKDVKTDADAQKVISAADASGYPVSYELVKFSQNCAQFIIDQWNAGHKLTEPYWIGGVNHINPAAVHYTKPILILINHLDFSGGDFFPTILQDNKRVKILGTRTAGAGGYVNDVTVPNNVGINAFRVTESIAERVSGHPIENLGVTPDVVYELTDADFTQGFAPYVKAIQNAIQSLN